MVRYQDLAFRTAYVITGDATEAEDTAQTGFVKAYFALDRFRSGDPFRPWLLKIVANEARNRRKAQARHPAIDLTLIEEFVAADPSASPEEASVINDRNQRLIATLNLLREEDRAIIAYRYFFDLTETEMADALGCRRGTVKSRLSRAMGRLRETIENAEGWDDV